MDKLTIDVVIKELDNLLDHKDYDGAIAHLKKCLDIAKETDNKNVAVAILNEQIGIYRKTGKKEECLEAIDGAFQISKELNLDGTVTMGTTYLNAATGLKSFNMDEEALAFYEKAEKIYNRFLNPDDSRMSGLYNNMAITLTSLGQFTKAKNMFFKAIEIKKGIKNGLADIAVTYCNLADFVVAEKGIENSDAEVDEYLEKAMDCLNSPSLPRNGYYAFVCDKCAPVFGYYGYFLYEKELNKRAEEIYDRN